MYSSKLYTLQPVKSAEYHAPKRRSNQLPRITDFLDFYIREPPLDEPGTAKDYIPTNTVIKTISLPGLNPQKAENARTEVYVTLLKHQNLTHANNQYYSKDLTIFLQSFLHKETKEEKFDKRQDPYKTSWIKISMNKSKNSLYDMLAVESKGEMVEANAYKGKDLQKLVSALLFQHLDVILNLVKGTETGTIERNMHLTITKFKSIIT